jgi:hypothetical protein
LDFARALIQPFLRAHRLPTGDVRMMSLIFKPEAFDPFITGCDEDLTKG